jgi:hypothetical protein
MWKLSPCFILIIILNTGLFAQNVPIYAPFLLQSEDSLKPLFSILGDKEASDDDKLISNKKITAILNDLLKKPESYNFPFDSLKKMGKIVASDNAFRIYNWNLPLHDGTHVYYAYIQVKDKDGRQCRVYPLTDKSSETSNPERALMTDKNWFGALYYQIIPRKIKERVYYTLLGLDYNNIFTSKKIIEVMYFDGNKNIHFGAPIFKSGKIVKDRVIFEYSAMVNMALNYDRKNEMIIFDHLSPDQSKFKDIYDHYGPDFSYDAFVFKQDMWVYQPNIDARNKK